MMRLADLPAYALGITALTITLTVAGCAPQGEQPGTAPVIDPYIDTGDGGARYAGDVTAVNEQGVLPGTASPQGFAAAAGDTVTFSEERVVLSSTAQAIIARQAEWLTRNKDFRVTVEGHADEQGTREYNLALGARRAAAVQEYLIAHGVEPGRVSTVSYGNERPLETCDSDECMARNRRAVTVVTPGAAGV